MGEKRFFFAARAVSHRGNFAPFQTRRALSRLKDATTNLVSFARSEKTPRVGSRARRARARLHTRTSATHERPRHDVSLAIRLVCTSRRHVRRRTVRARVFPSSPRPREDHAEALGVDERGRVRRARVPGGRRGGLRRRAVAQRAGRDVLPLRLRGGAAVRVRAAPASRRARAREPSSPPRRTVSLTLFSSRRRDALNPSSDEPARAPSWVWGRSAASPRSDTPPASASGARRGSSRAGSAASARSAAPCTAAKFDAGYGRREDATNFTRRLRTNCSRKTARHCGTSCARTPSSALYARCSRTTFHGSPRRSTGKPSPKAPTPRRRSRPASRTTRTRQASRRWWTRTRARSTWTRCSRRTTQR